MNIIGVIQEEKNKKYNAINNCPRCRGALIFSTDYFGNRKKVIRCFQCGFVFEECRVKVGDNGKNKRDKKNNGAMYIRPLYPIVRRPAEEENKKTSPFIFG